MKNMFKRANLMTLLLIVLPIVTGLVVVVVMRLLGHLGPRETTQTPCQRILHKMQHDYVVGRFKQVIETGKGAVTKCGNDQTMVQLMGASYCHLKDAEGARRAIDLLPSRRTTAIRQVCARVGVNLLDKPKP